MILFFFFFQYNNFIYIPKRPQKKIAPTLPQSDEEHLHLHLHRQSEER
jgi:hypothetical protein